MHHIYTTPAFVIHSTPHGEAGKFLLLFTKDFGMIGATAQGVRLSKSKLRSHVQDFSFTNISIVKGKEVWRVTGAHEIAHVRKTVVHLKILKLLKRLLHGEEKNEKLFEIIEKLYETEIEEMDFELVECLTVFRTLNRLGYINNKNFSGFLENDLINNDIISGIRKIKPKIIVIINSALKESHL